MCVIQRLCFIKPVEKPSHVSLLLSSSLGKGPLCTTQGSCQRRRAVQKKKLNTRKSSGKAMRATKSRRFCTDSGFSRRMMSSQTSAFSMDNLRVCRRMTVTISGSDSCRGLEEAEEDAQEEVEESRFKPALSSSAAEFRAVLAWPGLLPPLIQ